jgi:hypothetical protein
MSSELLVDRIDRRADLVEVEPPARRQGSILQQFLAGREELWDSGAMLLIEWGERFPNLWPQQRGEIHQVQFLNADQ